MVKATRSRGRPTVYREDMPSRAYDLMRECGLTLRQLARAFGVNVRKLYRWMKAYPEFSAAVHAGRDEFDSQVVEKALLRRAIGYCWTEITEGLRDGKMVVTRKVRKYVVSDVTAQIFWLKNRSPQRWRDRQDMHVEGGLTLDATNDIQSQLIEKLVALAAPVASEADPGDGVCYT